jgi:acetyltransferase-like isoleucine patch superfamily enzyme
VTPLHHLDAAAAHEIDDQLLQNFRTNTLGSRRSPYDLESPAQYAIVMPWRKGAWIGAGATIIQKRQVGAWSMIGAGAVVVADIKPGVVAFGNPASVQRNISTGKTSV